MSAQWSVTALLTFLKCCSRCYNSVCACIKEWEVKRRGKVWPHFLCHHSLPCMPKPISSSSTHTPACAMLENPLLKMNDSHFSVSSLSVFLNWFSCMPLLDPRVAFLHLLYSQESSLQLHPPLQRIFSKGKAPSDSTQQWNVIRLSQLMGITAAYTWRVEQVW